MSKRSAPSLHPHASPWLHYSGRIDLGTAHYGSLDHSHGTLSAEHNGIVRARRHLEESNSILLVNRTSQGFYSVAWHMTRFTKLCYFSITKKISINSLKN